MTILYGHTLPNQSETCWQPLDEHLRGTACLARTFAQPFGAGQTGGLLGMIHDDGKRSQDFQKRLHHKAGRVDHSTASGRRLLEEWPGKAGENVARLLAYALLGHHGGMPDYGSLPDVGTLYERLYGTNKPIAEAARQQYGPEQVREVMISEAWYRETMPLLKAGIEDRTLILPKDAGILSDFRSMRVVKGVARVPDLRTTDRTGNRHGDSAVACAMMLDARKELGGAEPWEYVGVGMGGINFNGLKL